MSDDPLPPNVRAVAPGVFAVLPKDPTVTANEGSPGTPGPDAERPKTTNTPSKSPTRMVPQLPTDPANLSEYAGTDEYAAGVLAGWTDGYPSLRLTPLEETIFVLDSARRYAERDGFPDAARAIGEVRERYTQHLDAIIRELDELRLRLAKEGVVELFYIDALAKTADEVRVGNGEY